MNRDMSCRRPTRKGYPVLATLDGMRRTDVARSDCPDVIIMDLIIVDLTLPRNDRWEACRPATAGQSTNCIRIIALTAHAMSMDREKAFAAGCDIFDTKPADLVGPLETIERACGQP